MTYVLDIKDKMIVEFTSLIYTEIRPQNDTFNLYVTVRTGRDMVLIAWLWKFDSIVQFENIIENTSRILTYPNKNVMLLTHSLIKLHALLK